jgi:hypothetical protein
MEIRAQFLFQDGENFQILVSGEKEQLYRMGPTE